MKFTHAFVSVSVFLLLAPVEYTAEAALRVSRAHNAEHPAVLPNEIKAFYINMPDREGRRAFAESQYQVLDIVAERIPGTAKPNKILGGLAAWLQAVDACANEPISFKYCLIAEDDAVYRTINSTEAQALDDNGWPAYGKSNTTADPAKFFPALTAAVATLPGGSQGSWTGLHLCTLGEAINLNLADDSELVQGGPWPMERFSKHKVYPGAPDVLFLQRREVSKYRQRLSSYIDKVRANGTAVPIDLLQSQMYSDEDASASDSRLKVFVADNPQLCRHLTDLSNDKRFRSSVGDGASARDIGSYTNKWGSTKDKD